MALQQHVGRAGGAMKMVALYRGVRCFFGGGGGGVKVGNKKNFF